MCFKDFAHQKLSSTFPSLYLTSCSSVGVCCEWVPAVGAGRGTGEESKYIVSYKCNIESNIQLVRGSMGRDEECTGEGSMYHYVNEE